MPTDEQPEQKRFRTQEKSDTCDKSCMLESKGEELLVPMNDAMTNDPAKEDLLILVDGRDRPMGTATKEDAHRQGLLHRAFSVMLVRRNQGRDELLLAQRAAGKYHSAGLWANSCCSHPRAGEELLDAAYRRVHEELGCEARGLRELTAFIYRAEFPDGICEYEYDHVLLGECEGEPNPDPAEVGAVKWIPAEDVARELADNPTQFSAWAFTVLSHVLAELAGRDA